MVTSGRRRARAVGSEDANIGAQPEIAERLLRRRQVRHAGERRGLLARVLKDDDGKIEPEAHAVVEDERAAGVHRDEIANQARVEPVVLVDDDDAIRAVHSDAERRANFSSQVERVGDEPLRAMLGRVVTVDGDGPRLLRAGCRRDQDKSKYQPPARAHSVAYRKALSLMSVFTSRVNEGA